MNRSLTIPGCVAFVFVIRLAAATCYAGEQPPNILFIFADDQCFETIHALGNDEIETPNLDRLARAGGDFHARLQHGCLARSGLRGQSHDAEHRPVLVAAQRQMKPPLKEGRLPVVLVATSQRRWVRDLHDGQMARQGRRAESV